MIRRENKGRIVDVFDADSGEYITSACFPFLPFPIINGYIFKEEENEEGFKVFNKYKIDPAVYGK